MIELSQVLEKVRNKIAQHQGKGITEANTKIAMIDPVLRALDWEVGNIEEVSLEYRKTSTDDPVDYALFLQGKPKLFVEAKALGQKVDGGKWANQIMGYAGVAGVKWVVLTNGDEYRIYNACVEVPFEEKLLCAVRLTDPNSPTESALALLSKQGIADADIETIWQTLFADRQVLAVLRQLFSTASEKMLMRYVKKHAKGLSPKEIHASLLRVCAQVSFPAEITIPPGELKKHTPVSLRDMLESGILKPGKITAKYKSADLDAELLATGVIRFGGKDYQSCSAAGSAAKHSATGETKATNGWTFWEFQDASGKQVTLESARKEYLKHKVK